MIFSPMALAYKKLEPPGCNVVYSVMIMFIRLDTTITAYDRQTDTEHTEVIIIYRSGVTSCD